MRGYSAKALAALDKAKRLAIELYREQSDEVANLLDWSADLLMDLERFDESEKARAQAIATFTRLHGKGYWKVLDGELAQRDIRHRKTLGRKDLDALRKARLAQIQSAGLYRENLNKAALVEARSAAAIYKRVLGDQSPLYAYSLSIVAAQQRELWKFRDAILLYQESEERLRTLVGTAHPYHRTAVQGLFKTYNSAANFTADVLGNYELGVCYHFESLAVARKWFGEKSPEVGVALNNIGLGYISQEEFGKSEETLRNALTHYEAIGAKESAEYATTLHNMGLLYAHTEDYNRALLNFKQSIALRDRLGKKDWRYADTIEVMSIFQSLDEAIDAMKQVALIRERENVGGAKEFLTWGYLGQLYLQKGDVDEGMRWLLKMNEASKEWASDHPMRVAFLWQVAYAYELSGQNPKARQLYSEAVALAARRVGKTHRLYAMALSHLGRHLFREGDVREAARLLKDSTEISGRRLSVLGPYQSERHHLSMIREQRTSVGSYLSIAPTTDMTAETVYSYLLPLKGAAFMRQRLIRSLRGTNELIAEFAKLEATAVQIAALSESTASDPRGDQADRLAKLTERFDSLERKLAQDSGPFRRPPPVSKLTPARLAAALPAGAVLVDYYEVPYFIDDPKDRRAGHSVRRLIAFIVRPGQPVSRIDLETPMEEVEQLITAWRQAIGAADEGLAQAKKQVSHREVGAKLRQAIWQPVAKLIGGSPVVFVAPDGALAAFPFDALPGEVETRVSDRRDRRGCCRLTNDARRAVATL